MPSPPPLSVSLLLLLTHTHTHTTHTHMHTYAQSRGRKKDSRKLITHSQSFTHCTHDSTKEPVSVNMAVVTLDVFSHSHAFTHSLVMPPKSLTAAPVSVNMTVVTLEESLAEMRSTTFLVQVSFPAASHTGIKARREKN